MSKDIKVKVISRIMYNGKVHEPFDELTMLLADVEQLPLGTVEPAEGFVEGVEGSIELFQINNDLYEECQRLKGVVDGLSKTVASLEEKLAKYESATNESPAPAEAAVLQDVNSDVEKSNPVSSKKTNKKS